MAEHEQHKEGEASHGSHGGHGGHVGGHGGGHEEHEGAPEWLISFADNVALLMGFFVILLAMNMGPKTTTVQGGEPSSRDASPGSPDMLDFVIAMRAGFNNPINPMGTIPEEEPFRKRIIERSGGTAFTEAPAGRHQELQAARPSDHRQITASVTYDDDSALLSGSARKTLIETAGKIRDQAYVIEVRGHVSPFEARMSLDAAMRLSYDRALAAARALMEGGVKRANLRIVSCADNDRVVPKAFDAAAARSNQRVEVVITNETIQPDPFSVKAERSVSGGR